MGSPKAEKGDQLWFRVTRRLLPHLVTSYFKLVDRTSKKIFLNREYEEQTHERGPFTAACFHGTMLFPIYYCRKYPGVIMVSRSYDGDLIDACLRHWGYDTTRGSSSRGGKEALEQLIDMIRDNNYCSGLAVDAPRGPARQVKMGTVLVGRETGQPVLPLLSWTTRHIRFGSWDSMILPLPFSTIVMVFGAPTYIPQGLDRDDYERLRQEIERNMIEASNLAEATVAELKRKKKWRILRFAGAGTRGSNENGDK